MESDSEFSQDETYFEDSASLGPLSIPENYDKDGEDHASISKRIILNPLKAGLQKVDHSKANRVILEASKGSKFFKSQLEKNSKVVEKMNHLKDEFHRLQQKNLSSIQHHIDTNIIPSLHSLRCFTRTIVHIDMDAFFASVEELENPQLKGKPMAVGGKSMLSTANYVARQYGVRSAMPGYIGLKLCPELIIVPHRFDLYQKKSQQVRSILMEYDENYQPMGLDEAYLDITNFMKSHGESLDPQTIVAEIRRKIFEKTQLTASAGIAANKMLAKICSDINKPNGQFFLPNDCDAVSEFMKDLPVRRIPGIGRVSEQLLSSIGIQTCSEIVAHRTFLHELFSQISFQFYLKAALGIGSIDFETFHPRKSISCERTFRQVSSLKDIFRICFELCEDLAFQLKCKSWSGKCITVKFKSVDFDLRTRAITLSRFICSHQDIYDYAVQIIRKEFDSCKSDLKLRLLGVRVSNLNFSPSDGVELKITDFFTSAKPSPPCSNHSISAPKCPICSQNIPVDDNILLNQHIDLCLNSSLLQSSSQSV